ncbi:MAG TPA: AI-2E family transporter [Actinomycetes bacterium]|nr:AI-2E family transporter [Actinomycetes bacterium]
MTESSGPEEPAGSSPAPPGSAARELASLGHYARVTVTVLAVVAVALLAYRARGVLILVLSGFLIAAGLDPLVAAVARRGLRRGLAVALVFGAGLLATALFVVLALAPAIGQFAQVVTALPGQLQELGERLQGSGPISDWLAREDIREQAQTLLDRVPALLASSVGALFGAVTAVIGLIFAGFTVAALSVYFLLALPRIRRFAAAALGDPERAAVMSDALGRVGGYITGQLAICLLHGVCSYIVFVILDLPYAALLAVTVAILDAVPQVGALLGALVALVFAVPLGIVTSVAVVVYFVVYQQLENYVVAPRVFSRAVELSPLAVFVAVLVGATLTGLVGAVAALPVTAAGKVVLRYVFRDRLARIEASAHGVDPEPGVTAAGADDGPAITVA